MIERICLGVGEFYGL